MYRRILVIFTSFCLHPGLLAEECFQTVQARRQTFYVPLGGSHSLSCVVQHCGDYNWKGDWIWKQSSDERFSVLTPTVRYIFSNMTLSANQTLLVVNLLNASQSDEGSYGCVVTWNKMFTDNGHMTFVNITSAFPSSERSVLHRVLVCLSASLCLPLILGLAHCLSSEVKPQPFPRTVSMNYEKPSASLQSHPCQAPQPLPRRQVPPSNYATVCKATAKPKPKIELVYAALSEDALAQPQVTRQPAQDTVYSSLRIS